MKTQTFEKWIEEKFIGSLEVGGVPITKDNFEDMFSTYLENLDTQDAFDLAEEWGEKRFLEGKELVLKTFEPNIEKLKEMLVKTSIKTFNINQ